MRSTICFGSSNLLRDFQTNMLSFAVRKPELHATATPKVCETLVEFHAHVLVVLVDGKNGFGRRPLSANDSGHERLDDVIAERRIAGQLARALRGAIATGLAESFHETFVADLGQIVSRAPSDYKQIFRSRSPAGMTIPAFGFGAGDTSGQRWSSRSSHPAHAASGPAVFDTPHLASFRA